MCRGADLPHRECDKAQVMLVTDSRQQQKAAGCADLFLCFCLSARDACWRTKRVLLYRHALRVYAASPSEKPLPYNPAKELTGTYYETSG